MKIKEVMQKTGIPEKTIRYYETRGLITTATERRNGRTYHEFSEKNVKELENILLLRQARFSLEEIERMQRDPEQIRQVVRDYRGRMEQENRQLRQLTEAKELEKAVDWNDLSKQIRRAFCMTPGYTPEVHFGRFDGEPKELRQAAIAAYHNKQENGRGPLIAVIIALGLLCAILIGVLVYSARQTNLAVPTPTTSTTGWVYYEYRCNLMRSREDGSQAELIYQRKDYDHQPQYIISELKIYVLDDNKLYSINADGSGEYEYKPRIGTLYLNDGGVNNLFLLDGSDIYVSQVDKGRCWVTRVAADGRSQEKLNVNLSDWSSEAGVIWDNKLYLFGGYMEAQREYVMTPAALVYDLEKDQVVAEYDGELDEKPAQDQLALWFGEEFGYLEEGNKLLSVSPDTLKGELVKEFPGKVVAAAGNYVLYQNDSTRLVLENLDTGAQTFLPGNGVNYQFSEEGLRAVYTEEKWELIEYP